MFPGRFLGQPVFPVFIATPTSACGKKPGHHGAVTGHGDQDADACSYGSRSYPLALLQQ